MAELAVHVAVLTIGESGAMPDDASVVERLRAAGHDVVARTSVDNFVPVVRRQLGQWVADANIDVIIAVGGGDDNVASAALGPLVTQPLPGFGDVFRMLVFQALGSVAVIANGEAARCTKTVVFLLPALADAVKLALDKLIVPQLDLSTEPSNIARMLPRRDGAGPAPTGGKHAASATAPPRTAPARTTPPPFRKVPATPPVGLVVTPPGSTEPAAVDKPVPAPDAAAPGSPATSNSDNKVVVDIETLGGVVEPEDSGTIRAARDDDPAAPAKRAADPAAHDVSTERIPVAITKTKHARDPDATDRVFVIKQGDLSRRGMFGRPRTQIGPVTKGLAVLALLALGGAAGVLIWSRIGTRRVAASNQQPRHDAGQLAVAPPPPPVESRVDAATAMSASDIDMEPATPPDAAQVAPPVDDPAAQHPHDQEARQDRSDRTRPSTHVVAPQPAQVPAQVPPVDAPVTSPSQRLVQPVTPVAPVTPPTSVADGCDEVTCVLDSYARPCCLPYKPKAPSQHPGIADTLDRTAVQQGVNSMRAVVLACGERFKVHGQVRVALEVAPDGHVTSSTVASSPDEGLGACVAEALRRVQFKQTVNGGHFTYPYAF